MKSIVLFHHSFSPKFWLKTFSLVALWLCFNPSAHAILKNWSSTSSTDWNNAANWSPAGVPTAADSVRIATNNTANVSINSGVTARAKNILLSGRSLTVQSGGELIVEGTYTSFGLGVVTGTINNNGVITVKRGFNGLEIASGGYVNNSGTLNMGEATASPYSFLEEAIRLTSDGVLYNQTGGELNITRSGNNGILVFSNSASATNDGILNINVTGLYPPDANTADGIDTRGTFVNETVGQINITNTGANGIVAKGGGSLNNKGILSINGTGKTAGTDDQHGIWGDGNIANSGNITINNAPRNGIIQLSNTFNNYGDITLGNTGTIGNYGLVVGPNGGNFNNQSGANIHVRSSANGGVLLASFGSSTLTNFSGATIDVNNVAVDGLVNFFSIVDNRGNLNIGNTGTIGRYGILNSAAFGNQFSGNINVKNAASGCIVNAVDPTTAGLVTVSFQNTGIVTAGASGGVPTGIHNSATCEFKNLPCGQITTWQRIVNAGIFTNEALLVCNNTAANSNSGTFTNDGVIADPNNVFASAPFTNNDLWVKPITACTSQGKSPVLAIGSANSFSVGTTWMNGPSAAGTYIQASNTFTPSSSLAVGNYNLSFSATGSGCSFQVTIPVQIANPPDVTISTTGGLNYVCPGGSISLQANLSASTGTVTYLWSNGSTAPGVNVGTPGTYSVTVTQSTGGCTDVASMNIVSDPIAPVAKCVSNLTVNLSSPTITVSQINNGSSDNCSIASMTLSKSSFNCSNLGANTVVLTVKDVNNNSHTCSTIVNVVDNIVPVAVCQNVTVQLNSSGSASTTAAAVNNGSSDNCGIASMTLSTSSFDCSNVGSNTVTLTVKDGSNNSATCTATVNVEDNIAPTAICQNVTVQLNSSGNGSTTAAAVNNGSSDNCGIASLSLSTTDFSCDNVGGNMVTLTVTDGYNNSSTCFATVTVEDNVAPVAACQPLTITLNVESGDVVITPEDVDNGSNDACGIASLSLDETTFTCADLGENTVTLTAEDVNGNTATCTATITVEQYPFEVTLPICQTVYYGYAPASCANINSSVSGGASPFTYAWSSGQTTADIQYCATSPSSPAPFILTVTDANGCTSTSTETATVHVVDVRCGNNNNKVLVCHNGNNTICINQGSVADHLAHGDQLGSCGAPNPCGSGLAISGNLDDEIEHAEHSQGGFMDEKLGALQLYPNPASGYVVLDLSAFEGRQSSIKLINLLGSTVMEHQLEALPYGQIKLELNGVKEGVYWVYIEIEGKRSMVQKLVVTKP